MGSEMCIRDSNDNNMNSRRKDKSAIVVIDHAVSDVMQPSCDGINALILLAVIR